MSLLKSSNAINSPSNSKPKTVRFSLTCDLKSLFLSIGNEKENRQYKGFLSNITALGEEIRDEDLINLLKEARNCISLLDINFKLFVQVILLLKWYNRVPDVIAEYQGFLVDLCSAHTGYTRIIVEHLVSAFKTVDESCNLENCVEYIPNSKSYIVVHQLILKLITVIPMSKDLLLVFINQQCPYYKKSPLEQAAFYYNVLFITTYLPQLRQDILKIILSRLVSIDVNIPKADKDTSDGVFQMEVCSEPSADSTIDTLDISLVVVWQLIRSQCFDRNDQLVWDKTKSIYNDLIKAFEVVLLPTHAPSHPQFLLFLMTNLKPTLYLSFIQLLWSKVTNIQVAPVIRQTAVSYIASLLCRGLFIPIGCVQDVLVEMCSWIHSYIDNHDGAGQIVQDVRIHGVFYATCQAVFYLIVFRCQELVHNNKGLKLLSGLNLSKIVTCRLNPLKSCLNLVVSKFASIARNYQLVYCYTVIERNNRSTLPQIFRDASGCETILQPYLDTFFPFDPVSLPRLESVVKPLYREYPRDSVTYEVPHSSSHEDSDDDFLETELSEPTSSRVDLLFSTSPGFLQKI